MHGLENVVGLIAVVVATSVVARRIGVLSPILLVVVGIGISFIPGVLEIELEPEVVLLGILPPILYVAALETSVPAFKFNLRPILLLAVGLVLFTAAAVGFTLNLLLPAVPLAACFALGAVVAPPDAVAATAVARRIGLPRRVVTVLEGESLINDATALVTLRVAVAAAVGQAVDAWSITEQAAVAVVGGVAIGVAGGIVIGFVHKRITNPLIDNAVSLLTPWVVFLPAESIHASGVVAVVVTGLMLGHRMPTLMSAASRLQMDAFWRMVKFLLEGAVFLLVGLQLRSLIMEVERSFWFTMGALAAVVGVVIVTRIAWLFPTTYFTRLIPRVRRRDPSPPLAAPAVISWAGMRGAVTLAAALSLPTQLANGHDYPRGLFVLLAFGVIVATLVLQGATLPTVARWLKVPPDDEKEDALAEASVQHEASRAGKRRLEEVAADAPEGVVERLRQVALSRSNMAWERLGRSDRETPSAAYARLRREMLNAEREVFRQARDTGRIPEETLRQAQRDMDLEESLLERGDHES
ncbi:Na+/H+ antiporter [Dactylosporangium sucinum]|uniref:Na+/H+ antiporter n=1 Tax=Dactylosporangium sucinum TaxID=1424081 RepID=A0A917X8E6_9ACTN|nr:Na+/H+ antiporter [Dactylosporangium sucinum]GGM90083.1 Na+/H+ antiporter [Dactylosporangium sucinum]